MDHTDNKRLVKNTIFLYIRMLLIIFVSLFTSRVTLQILGVDDFGIQQTVGGVVTFLAFISNALGSGTSRFITYELGKEEPQLDRLFSTVRLAHIVLGVLVVIVGEIVGLWFLNNKLIIPPERMKAATIAFHFSILTTFFQITQVPYNAVIIAYEKMDVFAYVSIAEAVLKLVIVYCLLLTGFDKLIVYSILLCLVTIIIMYIYRLYCRLRIKEVRTKLVFDKIMFKSVAIFSGWHILTSSAMSFANQGVTIVTNMFFSPAVVTVRSLGLRINGILNQFIGSFRTAMNPQIVKRYAAHEFEESKKLALSSTKYTYYLTFLIVLPLFLLIEPVLTLWLGNVPEGTVLFTKFALIQALFQAFDTSLYVPIYAKGQIKENAIISPLFDFIQLPAVYILFKLGFPPIALSCVELFACISLGIIIKPILVHKIVDYKLGEVYRLLLNCFIVSVFSCILPVCLYLLIDEKTIWGFIIIGFVCVISVLSVVWFFGLDKESKIVIKNWISNKTHKKEKLND